MRYKWKREDENAVFGTIDGRKKGAPIADKKGRKTGGGEEENLLSKDTGAGKGTVLVKSAKQRKARNPKKFSGAVEPMGVL